MAFRSQLKLNSKFFRKSERQQAFGTAAAQSAKEMERDLKQKMIQGPHTGKTYTRGKARGEGFTRKHRASRRGERPSPDTNELTESVVSERIGETSAKVAVGAEHAIPLQFSLHREIMTDSDVKEAEAKFNKRLLLILRIFLTPFQN